MMGAMTIGMMGLSVRIGNCANPAERDPPSFPSPAVMALDDESRNTSAQATGTRYADSAGIPSSTQTRRERCPPPPSPPDPLDEVPWPDLSAVAQQKPKLSQDEVAAGVALWQSGAFEYTRPKTRADCVNGLRPCPFVGCVHNLFADVSPQTGTIKARMTIEQFLSGERETCVLDVADRHGMTLEDVGAEMDLTRERVRQIESMAFAKMQIDIGEIAGELYD